MPTRERRRRITYLRTAKFVYHLRVRVSRKLVSLLRIYYIILILNTQQKTAVIFSRNWRILHKVLAQYLCNMHIKSEGINATTIYCIWPSFAPQCRKMLLELGYGSRMSPHDTAVASSWQQIDRSRNVFLTTPVTPYVFRSGQMAFLICAARWFFIFLYKKRGHRSQSIEKS